MKIFAVGVISALLAGVLGVAPHLRSRSLKSKGSKNGATVTNETLVWTPSYSPSNSWYSLVSDYNTGQTVVAGYTYGAYISYNFGKNWTKTGLNLGGEYATWGAMTCDQYCSSIVIGSLDGQVYYSFNNGTTWAKPADGPQATSDEWSSLASATSAGVNGAGWIVYATVDTGIYKSTNGGVNWSLISSQYTGYYFYKITSSANGQNLVALGYQNGVYSIWYSSNGGSSFTKSSFVFPCLLIDIAASRETGQYVIAGGYNSNQIFISSNYGKSWSSAFAPTNTGYSTPCYSAIAFNGDGQFAVATAQGPDERAEGYVYFSNNYGLNWVKTNAPSNVYWQFGVDKNATHWATGDGGKVAVGKIQVIKK